ncbi:hypothetical protein ACTXT7_014070 [Hymenolepis weldensis]
MLSIDREWSYPCETKVERDFLFQASEVNSQNQVKGKAQVLRKRGGATKKYLKAVIKNFCTAAHPGLDRNTSMEIRIGYYTNKPFAKPYKKSNWLMVCTTDIEQSPLAPKIS